MDPNATLRLMMEALADRDKSAFVDSLCSLVSWIDNGGFMPHGKPYTAVLDMLENLHYIESISPVEPAQSAWEPGETIGITITVKALRDLRATIAKAGAE